MKSSIEKATKVLAVTAALAAGIGSTASAKANPRPSKNETKATKLAHKLSKELYENPSKKVPVKGILNGSVEISHPIGGVKGFGNPIILVESHPAAKTDRNGKLLNGSWIGIPGYDAAGNIEIEPVHLLLGKDSIGETVSLHLKDKHNTVLGGAAIYASEVTNSGDALFGFDRTGNGNFPSVEITVESNK